MDEILNYIKDKDIMPQMITKESIVQKKDYEHMEDFYMGIYKPMFNEVAVKVENMLDFYNDNKQPVAKLNLYHTSSEDREETRKAIEGLDVVLANAETTSLEISAKNTTKGLGLQKLCEHLGISIDEAIAVGDADNDLDVLKRAGLSVAMGNANDNVKKIADVVVEDCDHDGCVQAIEKHLLL